MKDFKVITVVTNNLLMLWQVHAYLENLKEIGWIDNTQVLIYTEGSLIPEWSILKELYPTCQFLSYLGTNFIHNIIPVYLPIIRPFVLRQHFKQNIELENQTIVYTDTDILWVKKPDLANYQDGCYVSSTVHPSDYMSHEYLLGKEKQVAEDKLEKYKKIDILKKLADIVSITPNDIIRSYDYCGGVQYTLNQIDWTFWDKVMVDCLSIRVELANLNRRYMIGNTPEEKENNGFQSWCADLWAVLYNLIYRRFKISTPKELDFAWATDKIERLQEVGVLHNAGVTSDGIIRTTKLAGNGINQEIDAPAFYKGKYANLSISPFHDSQLDYLTNITNNSISKEFCTGAYAQHLLNIKNKYKINY